MIIIERPQGPARFGLYVVPLVQDRTRGDAPSFYGATEATWEDMERAGYVPQQVADDLRERLDRRFTAAQTVLRSVGAALGVEGYETVIEAVRCLVRERDATKLDLEAALSELAALKGASR